MDIIITDIHGRAALRIARRADAPFSLMKAEHEPGRGGTSAEQREAARQAAQCLGIAAMDQPLHTRVVAGTTRSRAVDVVEHVTTVELPKDSFWRIIPRDRELVDWLAERDLRLLVDAPALSVLSFARAALHAVGQGKSGPITCKVVPVARTMGYVGELCGTYARGWDGFEPGDTHFELAPVLTLNELAQYLDAVRYVDGSSVAGVAAHWSAERQDSPMEVLLRAALVMRPGLGGLHLPMPANNEPLPLTAAELKLIKHDTITPDLFWKLYKLILEYDGPDHRDDKGVLEDKRRIQDYQALGYTVFPVTAEDVRTVGAFDRFARPVIRKMAQVEGPKLTRRTNKLFADPDYRARRSLLLCSVGVAD